MKKSIRSLVALFAVGVAAVAGAAEPAVKILVVDMAKLYDGHYKTLEQNAKIQADRQKADEEVQKMNQEGNALVAEFTNLKEQSENAALTAEAKSKAQNDAAKKYQEIEAKQNEIRTFIQNTGNSLNQRLQSFRSLLLEEITKVATDVAKRRGATVLVDKAGPSLIGISNILYTDPAYEITDEVSKEINKDRPATAPAAAPATSTPAATPSATTTPSSGPTINLPIAPKK